MGSFVASLIIHREKCLTALGRRTNGTLHVYIQIFGVILSPR
jgi:hypothetical protein